MKRIESRYCPVVLEPELEKHAALWSPSRRRVEARKLQRWVRQLMVSAAVMEARAVRPVPRLKVYPLAKLMLN